MNAHQMDINEGMTLKHEMDKEEEEVETIEWYRPERALPFTVSHHIAARNTVHSWKAGTI